MPKLAAQSLMIPNTDIFKILETNANKIKDNVDKSIKKSVENLDKSNGTYLKIFVFKSGSHFSIKHEH